MNLSDSLRGNSDAYAEAKLAEGSHIAETAPVNLPMKLKGKFKNDLLFLALHDQTMLRQINSAIHEQFGINIWEIAARDKRLLTLPLNQGNVHYQIEASPMHLIAAFGNRLPWGNAHKSKTKRYMKALFAGMTAEEAIVEAEKTTIRYPDVQCFDRQSFVQAFFQEVHRNFAREYADIICTDRTLAFWELEGETYYFNFQGLLDLLGGYKLWGNNAACHGKKFLMAIAEGMSVQDAEEFALNFTVPGFRVPVSTLDIANYRASQNARIHPKPRRKPSPTKKVQKAYN